jgi:hypothetical protein
MSWLDLNAKATDDADWAVAVDIVDNATGQPYDVSALEFRLEVTDCGTAVLTAGTEAGFDVLMTRPSVSQIAWRFPKASMAGLCAGKTYKVGCVHEDGDGNITQFIVGDLAIVDGGMA